MSETKLYDCKAVTRRPEHQVEYVVMSEQPNELRMNDQKKKKIKCVIEFSKKHRDTQIESCKRGGEFRSAGTKYFYYRYL